MSEWTSRAAHVVKKRASQACEQCRSRKVKCDVVPNGPPCQNCRDDGVQCNTTSSKRTRKYRMEQMHQRQRAAIERLTEPSSSARAAVSSHEASCNIDATPNSNRIRDIPATAGDAPRAASSSGGSGPLGSTQLDNGISNLPSYIRSPSCVLDSEQLAYLKQRGALFLPSPTLLESLLLACIVYVYPTLPVVDLQELVDAIEGRPGCQVSLLLLQAILFSGTAFVDLQLLRDAGYDNRIAARADFFHKIKASCAIQSP